MIQQPSWNLKIPAYEEIRKNIHDNDANRLLI